MRLRLFKKTICAKILFFVGFHFNYLNGQIIYTDIEPDFTSFNVGDNYNLDLNNDGIDDFNLKSFYEADYYWFEIKSSNSINAIIATNPWYSNPMPLESGYEVFEIVSYAYPSVSYNTWGFFTTGDCFGGEIGCYYDWKLNGDKFLGLRFLINGQTHYGWARLNVVSQTQWVFKDYAYNATPNKPIIAGQMVLAINEADFEKVKIMVSNGKISITNLQEKSVYSIHSINGQRMQTGNLETIDNTINVEILPSGIYLIEILSLRQKTIVRRKLIIP